MTAQIGLGANQRRCPTDKGYGSQGKPRQLGSLPKKRKNLFDFDYLLRDTVDLDKVCVVRIQKQAGHHYLSLLVRFVDGHEAHDLVPPEAAQHFLDAYREYLREQPAKQP